MRSMFKTLGCLVVLLGLGVAVYGQSILEDAATRRISQETGIDERLIGTLFIDDDSGQFILAFVYINEESVNGDLNPDIKAAITPFVGRNALLVLVVPASASFFDPFAISFVQNIFRVSVEPGMITPITDDFATGTLGSGAVSAGIIALDSRVLVEQAFEVQYSASYATTFALTPEAEATTQPSNSSSGGLFGGGLRFLLLNILLFFLFPFLLI